MFNPVMFVSLGPGDPELITLKGLKELQNADIVFCPSTILSNGKISSRAKNILLELGIDSSKINLFDVPMNKDRSLALDSYKNISFMIEKYYKDGYKVSVTAEGDAGFYSTIYYINQNLQLNNIPIGRIAGVPAFIASGTLANIHIVKQEEQLLIIPGIVTSEELMQKLDEKLNVVLMKTSQCESVIKDVIIKRPNAIFHYFENVGIENKEFYTSDIKNIEKRKFPYFSLVIIQNKTS